MEVSALPGDESHVLVLSNCHSNSCCGQCHAATRERHPHRVARQQGGADGIDLEGISVLRADRCAGLGADSSGGGVWETEPRAPARITRSLAAKKERRVDLQSRELATHQASTNCPSHTWTVRDSVSASSLASTVGQREEQDLLWALAPDPKCFYNDHPESTG